ncbi:MAG: ATP:corrinoid adenosyltransferase BtuR/CobO/CobP [archaeon GW2011_AR13]|nr:MAG: ATP:corrinoid adenosyltransferase BtuR/CobO/CobP [archaeon GW2011_AR13]HIG94491.1 cob(I)yrinic acid a,c-diamide adenosyltransferase [Nanoarchaeota archaeon]HIH63001.1 cob(I)yrinic acid a,c-diamide adenosyltransferase [Nanoarchaeota archaeon]HIJ10266.1 cob(I)yrinic acid a,c-diamide adenosyltransferase [Nanoarchaeota archaeon]
MINNDIYGYVHAIYGNGKGKTTSGIGLVHRALGYGLKVGIVQFMKGEKSNEIPELKQNSSVIYYSPGEFDWAFIEKGLTDKQRNHSLSCLNFVLNIPCDVNLLFCDEMLNVPLFGNGNPAFNYKDIINMVKNKRKNLEFVMTGLKCPNEVLDVVDYAQEIKMIKHVFEKGIIARPGIEI